MALQKYQQNHIETWRTSDLSQTAYCRKHGINTKTFGNWLRIYRSSHKNTRPATLIPVTIKSDVTSTDSLKLHCSGGQTLELPANVSPQWLGELLKCLD